MVGRREPLVHGWALWWRAMRNDIIGKAGVAAIVILAPGGFILGLALLARRYRGRGEPASARPGPPGEQQPAGDHQQAA